MSKKLSQAEYMKIIEQIEEGFVAELAKFESEVAPTLAKSESEDEKSEEDKGKDEPKKEESEAQAEARHSEESESKASEDSESDDDGYSDEDREEMQKMYDSMSKAEHRSHLKALKSSMSKCWKSEDIEKCWSDTGSMEKCGDIEIAKSETEAEAVSLSKAEVESLKQENEELKKNLNTLVERLNSHFTSRAPKQKAITSLEFIAKSEEPVAELSKSEVTAILTKKARTSSLSKSDRETINQYYGGVIGIEKIQHLLKN
jgi:hypothetical protein